MQNSYNIVQQKLMPRKKKRHKS